MGMGRRTTRKARSILEWVFALILLVLIFVGIVAIVAWIRAGGAI